LINFLNFFKNKKVLITGHTGFKGSWLSFWLLKLGAKVVGYSLDPPTTPNLFQVLKLASDVVDIRGDIRNLVALESVFIQHKPDIVIHLAAQPIVRISYEKPYTTFEVNFLGTLNLLELLRKYDFVKVALIVTSDKCYENKEWDYSYREIDSLGGKDPYSASKACVEVLVRAYRESYGLVVSTARAGNVLGGGDWQLDRLLPDCVKALSKGRTIKLRNPRSVRPWQYILDVLSGYLLLVKKMWEEPDKFCGAWNFGPLPSEVATVESIVNQVISLWGTGSYVVEDLSRDYREAGLLRLDISKSTLKLGWKPKLNLKETLEKTVGWYKRFYSGEDMRVHSLKELEDYERRYQ